MGWNHIGPSLCYAAAGALPLVCTVIVALRFYCRRTRGNHIGWDDWLLIPALVALIGMSAAILTVGYPAISSRTESAEDVSEQQRITRQIIWVVYLLGPISLTLVKVSFLLWYRRLFWQGSSKWYRAALLGVTLLLIAWGVSFFMAFLLICPGHPSTYWGPTAGVLAKCNKTTAIYQAYSTSDPILDIIIFVLPIGPLCKLQMSTKKRFGVICVFMLGAITIIASVLRMVVIWQDTIAEYKPGVDLPPLLTSGMYWGLVEGGVALISCCLPPCTVLFKKKNKNASSQRNLSDDSMQTTTTTTSARRSMNPILNPFATSHRTVASFDESAAAAARHSGVVETSNGIWVTKTYSTRPVVVLPPWRKSSSSASVMDSESELDSTCDDRR